MCSATMSQAAHSGPGAFLMLLHFTGTLFLPRRYFFSFSLLEVTMRFFPIHDYLVCLVYGEESSVSGTYILKEVTMRFFQFMTIWFALSMEKKIEVSSAVGWTVWIEGPDIHVLFRFDFSHVNIVQFMLISDIYFPCNFCHLGLFPANFFWKRQGRGWGYGEVDGDLGRLSPEMMQPMPAGWILLYSDISCKRLAFVTYCWKSWIDIHEVKDILFYVNAEGATRT
ncbi:Uncharacterized protein TCM_029574 [Theobroma cacao]|uniref:Uncharacterized protein n=1 Tax=Theobroma cacao TaxID=3641 RepID=A0A061GEK0_THECC|nr:Uncharacterized protein TCM_029574 [Theobroma cacao]